MWAGLVGRHGGFGAKRLLSPEQEAAAAGRVRRGPDLAGHGAVRWRRADLAQAVKAESGVVPAERRISAVLRRPGFRRLAARPRHSSHDAAAQASLEATSPPSQRRRCPSTPAASRPSSGGRNKARTGQQGASTRAWAEQRCPWAFLFGAVRPARGASAALALPFANAGMTSLRPAGIGANAARGAHAALIADGAAWRQAGGRLQVPDTITLLHLPPCSPELKPGRDRPGPAARQQARQPRVRNIPGTCGAIVEARCDAGGWLTAQPDRITSTRTREWARATQ